MVIPEQEGWYTDPWGNHDARWISEGVPSKLVRDGTLESYDEPPGSPPSQAWVPIEPLPGSQTALDTLRADDLEAETIPSLSELDKRADSAALTARAHPWFVAGDWVPSSHRRVPSQKAEAGNAQRRTALIAGRRPGRRHCSAGDLSVGRAGHRTVDTAATAVGWGGHRFSVRPRRSSGDLSDVAERSSGESAPDPSYPKSGTGGWPPGHPDPSPLRLVGNCVGTPSESMVSWQTLLVEKGRANSGHW